MKYKIKTYREGKQTEFECIESKLVETLVFLISNDYTVLEVKVVLEGGE